MTDDERHPVDILAEEFAQRIRDGQQPTVEDYAERYPEHAKLIRVVFPPIAQMEDAREKQNSTRPLSSASAGRVIVDAVPEVLGDFQLVRLIGQGGMGVVFEAQQLSLHRRVALKVIAASSALSKQQVERFRREAETAAALHHTNLVGVFGSGSDKGYHFYAMQFIEGVPLHQLIQAMRDRDLTRLPTGLQDVIDKDAPQPFNDQYDRYVATAVAAAASGLQHAHQHGILHRDLKPSNLIFDNDGTLWITDFGVAKQADVDDLTRSGEIVGTLRYMAPEQFRGTTDIRSDIYSLGLVLYELLALQPAFSSSDANWLEQARRGGAPPLKRIRPLISRDLATIVSKACAAEAPSRYGSAAELAEDLQRFVQDRQILARKQTSVERLWRTMRRNPLVSSLSVASLLLLLVIIGLMAHGNQEKQRTLAAISQEKQRAENNLQMALTAFAEIVDNIGSRGGAEALLNDLGDDQDWQVTSAATLGQADIVLLEQLLTFFEKFATENSADLSVQTAVARTRMADICQRLSRYDLAVQSYDQALEIYKQLAVKNPDDPQWIVAQVKILNELMVVHAAQGQVGYVVNLYQQARGLLGDNSQAIGSDEGKFALARVAMTMGSLTLRFGSQRRNNGRGLRNFVLEQRWQREMDANELASQLLQEITENQPTNIAYRLAFARVARQQAQLLWMSGKQSPARMAREQAISVCSDLVEQHPDVDAFKYELADTLRMLAPPTPEGQDDLYRAAKICDELLRKKPDSSEYLSLRSAINNRLAQTMIDLGDVELAIEKLRRAIEDQRSVAGRYPDVPIFQLALSRSVVRLVENLIRQEKFEQAQQATEQTLEMLDSLPRNPRVAILRERLQQLKERASNGSTQGGSVIKSLD